MTKDWYRVIVWPNEGMELVSVQYPMLTNKIETAGETYQVFPEGAWGSPEAVQTAGEAFDLAEEFLADRIAVYEQKQATMNALLAEAETRAEVTPPNQEQEALDTDE